MCTLFPEGGDDILSFVLFCFVFSNYINPFIYSFFDDLDPRVLICKYIDSIWEENDEGNRDDFSYLIPLLSLYTILIHDCPAQRI